MFQIPDHQVAGHKASKGIIGPLIDNSGRFYKPLQSNNRGSKEESFYKKFSSNTEIPNHIRKFFPTYYGTQHIEASDGSGQHPHLVLEDIVTSPLQASIRSLHPQNEWLLYTSTSLWLVHGLMTSHTYTVSNSNDVDGESDCAFAQRVYGGPNGVLAQLLMLKKWFEDQTLFHFYSCSVLMVYEKIKPNEDRSCVTIKLIDFAHVVDGQGVIDHNFLGGLCSLIKFVSEILDN
ncbi:inositol polyphosphate multikinase beta-like [Cannabis sativa]|uniref:inositol polyphosphate multikinase beta-like n=1 Tax=Cannabis sativa TaxID=3483 RepID=UPI0029C9B890|nr:inositol polyphosphate multikinase beta-like [Cannabis sativa]